MEMKKDKITPKKEQMYRNPYINFYVQHYKKNHNGRSVVMVAIEAGKIWTQMQAMERKPYYDMAKKAPKMKRRYRMKYCIPLEKKRPRVRPSTTPKSAQSKKSNVAPKKTNTQILNQKNTKVIRKLSFDESESTIRKTSKLPRFSQRFLPSSEDTINVSAQEKKTRVEKKRRKTPKRQQRRIQATKSDVKKTTTDDHDSGLLETPENINSSSESQKRQTTKEVPASKNFVDLNNNDDDDDDDDDDGDEKTSKEEKNFFEIQKLRKRRYAQRFRKSHSSADKTCERTSESSDSRSSEEICKTYKDGKHRSSQKIRMRNNFKDCECVCDKH